MSIYVYRDADGTLFSWCPSDDDPVADDGELAAQGLTALKNLPALDATHGWDPATKTVITVPAPSVPRPISPADFVLRFTPQEFAAVDASADGQVKYFLFVLQHAQTVDLDATITQQGVRYLEQQGLIASGRAAQILA